MQVNAWSFIFKMCVGNTIEVIQLESKLTFERMNLRSSTSQI